MASSKIPNFFTGSSETEGELRLWAHHAGGDLNAGVPRSVFTNEYYWKTMTVGRNGPGDRNNPLTRSGAVRLAAERGIVICGHRDLPNVHKSCPGFDVAAWLGNNMEAPV